MTRNVIRNPTPETQPDAAQPDAAQPDAESGTALSRNRATRSRGGLFSPLRAPETRGLLAALLVSQCLYYFVVATDLTLGALVGLSLAPSPWMATLPLTLVMAAGTLFSFAGGPLAQRLGYRVLLAAGAIALLLGSLLCCYAVIAHDFLALCLGMACAGAYRSTGGYLRYVAADAVPESQRGRALSLVLYGGILAAAAGPFAAVWASEWTSPEYLGSFLLVGGFALGALALSWCMPGGRISGGRRLRDREVPLRAVPLKAVPLREGLRNRRYWSALIALVPAGAVMSLLMAAGPLANHQGGNSAQMGAAIIQWHLIGMFAPAAFSEWLVLRLGLRRTVLVGFALYLVGGLSALIQPGVPPGAGLGGMSAGSTMGAVEPWMILADLLLVGVGWNVLFVAGSSLVAGSYPAGRGGVLQGFSEGFAAIFTAGGAMLGAAIFTASGWMVTNLVALAAAVAFAGAFLVVNPRSVPN
ncbi:MFS transporter [Psychromicrobium xiongbiense]|uniref:MFS transporter n=1 Tax=Psychromicrobium xiongbiense TaxID=3051184 RepID=UPI002552D55F|nr:MFS transporter [Psychromicrobium sp. YIM S02556]